MRPQRLTDRVCDRQQVTSKLGDLDMDGKRHSAGGPLRPSAPQDPEVRQAERVEVVEGILEDLRSEPGPLADLGNLHRRPRFEHLQNRQRTPTSEEVGHGILLQLHRPSPRKRPLFNIVEAVSGDKCVESVRVAYGGPSQ